MGTPDAVKAHHPREWASRGDDFNVRHRNNFCTFCRCHRDIARFDLVWAPATGLSSGLGRGDKRGDENIRRFGIFRTTSNVARGHMNASAFTNPGP